MDEILNIFNTTPAFDYSGIQLVLPPGNISIPADLFGQSRITGNIDIDGNINFNLIDIHPDAFRSSKQFDLSLSPYYQGLEINMRNLNANLLDLSFLADFDKLSSILFDSVQGLEVSLTTLPLLSQTRRIHFRKCTGPLEAVRSGIVLNAPEGLTHFTVSTPNGMTEEEVDEMLEWIYPTSNSTLVYLDISRNNMSIIPEQLQSFEPIKDLDFSYNRMNMTLKTNAINISGEYSPDWTDGNTYVTLFSSGVENMEAGVFQGNYTTARVNLDGNYLTRFEAEVFQLMVEQMVRSPILWAYVSLYKSNVKFFMAYLTFGTFL